MTHVESTDKSTDRPCPKADTHPGEHGPAQSSHACPYRAEIDNDNTECECCKLCRNECARDI